MASETNESTRVMGAAPAGAEPTVAAAAQPHPSQEPATQMGARQTCAVCGTPNSALEKYCAECGFLLSSTPGAPVAAPQVPSLRLVEPSTGRAYPLEAGTTTIGREGCDILLMDGSVSRRHAKIEVGPGSVKLTDLGSTNGTLVAEQRLQPNAPVAVKPGSVLKFGAVALTLEGAAPPVEAAGALPAGASTVQAVAGVVEERRRIGGAAPQVPAPSSSSRISTPPPASDGEEPAVARLKANAAGLKDILIRVGTTTIGRRPGNTVVISGDPYISGRHAELLCDATGCYLVDSGSTNGTVVNGERLEPGQKQLLLDGDEVTIGEGTYVFVTLSGVEEG
jgi:pSer/pThr/pTyr-binding forkhead associated (FHA) protein